MSKTKNNKKNNNSKATATVVADNVIEKRVMVLSTFRVLFLGILLVAYGATGFYTLPGMIKDDANGSRLVNSIYCSTITLTTIGFGDICPGNLEPVSKLFIVLFAWSGLGFFCGPLLDAVSSWTNHVPGGILTLTSLTVGLGVIIFSNIEGVSHSEAFYASIITGTTIGYGDLTPRSDAGKLAVAGYAILVVNVVAGLLKPCRLFLEEFCRIPLVHHPNKQEARLAAPMHPEKKITDSLLMKIKKEE